MKRNLLPLLSLAVVLSASTALTAYAQVPGYALVAVRSENGAAATSSARDAQASTSTIDRIQASTTRSTDEDTRASTSSNSVNGLRMSEDHRSVVASFAQSLLAVAEKEGGLGEQIRIIAQEQKDSVATTTEAIQKIVSRSGLKTLFFGSDYENLGILRSGMVKTQNDLGRLQAILASTTNATARATLAAQIQVLETDKTSIQSFVGAHENVFSLFGWFAKFFAKTGAGN